MRFAAFRRYCRFVVPPLAVSLAALAFPSIAAAGTCGHADRATAGSPAKQLRATTLRLINDERHARGLRPLRMDVRLGLAASGHSRDMVAHRYFAHDSRSGARFSARIARTGWMEDRTRWTVGENLAWGAGDRAAPQAIVDAWMSSAPHRANILKPSFRRIGIGICPGVPVEHSGRGATYTTDFGT